MGASRHLGLTTLMLYQRVMNSDTQASASGGTAPPPVDPPGAIVDEPGDVLIGIPFQPSICPVCLHAGQGYRGLSIQDYTAHIRKKHKGHGVVFRCTACLTTFKTQRGAQCHVPKCPGHPPPPQGFECASCGRGFKSKSGLSQHKRHEHPVVRNQERVASLPGQQERLPAALKVFDEADITMIMSWEQELRNDKRINKTLETRLGGKYTNKQISSLRSSKLYRQRVRPAEEPGGEIPPAPPQAEEEVDEPAQPEETTGQNSSDEAEAFRHSPSYGWWRAGIVTSISMIPADKLPEPAVGPMNALKNLAVNGGGQQELDEAYARVLEYIVGATDTPPTRPRRPGRTKQPGTRRGRKRFIFARTQRLFEQDPSLLAKHVRLGTDHTAPVNMSLDRNEVKDLYTGLWGTRPVVGKLSNPGVVAAPIKETSLLGFISQKEVGERVARIDNKSAPGLDKVKKAHLKPKPVQLLMLALYNICVITKCTPSEWSKNRTTLIPKEGKDQSDVKNYRPITVSSLLSRAFWGIMDQRLRKVVRHNCRQKGFVKEPGCFSHANTLLNILRHSKNVGQGLVAIQLDIAKAYDTVPHSVLGPALRRQGIPPWLINMVEESYTGAASLIAHPEGDVAISFERGVKQGDPLSPLLFNLVMDPLLDLLESSSGYYVNGVSISALAFADDLILVALDAPEALKLLGTVYQFLKDLGMELSVGKCAAFEVVPTKDSWYLRDPELVLPSGERIPYASADTILVYLGGKISPWEGIDLKVTRAHLTQVLDRVQKLALRPHQKLELLATHLVPHYLHQLTLAVPSVTLLRELDLELRGVVKSILHLPSSTTNGLIYCRKKDGGLGFPRLERIVTGAALKAGIKYINCNDPAVASLCSQVSESRLKKLAQSARLNWPPTLEQIEAWKRASRARDLDEWMAKKSVGKSAQAFADSRASNPWLYNPSLLKPCRFLSALKLRADVGANRTSLHRAIPQPDLKCRRCHEQYETLGHILGQCVHTKSSRIRRHDEIKDYIADKVMNANLGVVTTEPRLEGLEKRKKQPDLVIETKEGHVLIVDVTVRIENATTLKSAYEEKIEKYNGVLPGLLRTLGRATGEVLPIVVGARGAIPTYTVEALKRLMMADRGDLTTISMISLRSSLEMYHTFLDYDAPRVPGRFQFRDPG